MDNKEEKKEGFVLTDDNIPKFKEPLKPTIVEQTPKKKSVPIAIIIIGVLFLAIASIFGVKYYMDSKKPSSDNKPNNSDSEKEEDSSATTITQSELETYLSYIPFGAKDHSTLPYYNSVSTVIEIKKNLLINTAMEGMPEFKPCENPENCLPEAVTNASFTTKTYCYGGVCNIIGYDYYPLAKVDANLQKMYNINFTTTEVKEYDTWEKAGNLIMYYNNGFLIKEVSSWDDYVIHIIDRYEEKDTKLIIYEYAINGCYTCNTPKDFQNNRVISREDINPNNTAMSIADINIAVSNYVKKHKEDFTLFKHTFNQNGDGYSWYSSEVVK